MGRGRRTRQDFVEAAAGIVAVSGWASLTATTLAERLGVHATAVYRHIPSWNDLVVDVFDLSLAQLMADAMAALPANASPRERILGFMRSVRARTEADPNLADCVLAILRAEAPTSMPNLDIVSAQVVGLLREMGVPASEIPALYQAIESLAIGSIIVDYTGHPKHVENRRFRRRMSAVAEFETFTRSDEMTMSVSEAAFELSARLLLDECERTAAMHSTAQD